MCKHNVEIYTSNYVFMLMSESRRITRSKSLAIGSKTGKKLEHLHTIDMSKEETFEIFEKTLQPIKEAISKLMTEEVMLMHLEGFKSTFVQQLEEQKTVINSLKEDNFSHKRVLWF